MDIKITVINDNNDNSNENYSIEMLKKILSSTLLDIISEEYHLDFDIQEVTEKQEIVVIQNVKLFFHPSIGEFLTLKKQLYHVIGIEHNITKGEKGIIFVKKSNKVLQTVGILDIQE